MKRLLAAMAAAAISAGIFVAGGPAAGAAARPSIRTYVDAWHEGLTGIGADKGWSYGFTLHADVIRVPRLAFAQDTAVAFFGSNGKLQHQWVNWIFTGGHNYIRNNSHPTVWKKSTPTAGQIRAYLASTDPGTNMAKLRALPGLHLAAAREYAATMTAAQASGYLKWAYGISKDQLAGNKITTVTLTFWTNANGWPTKVVITGTSSIVRLNLTEALRYNQQLVIKVP